jgi:ketosteroid isomerase-like protein
MPIVVHTAKAASSGDDKAAVTNLERQWPVAIVNKDTGKLLGFGSADCWFVDPFGQIVPLKSLVADVKSGDYTVQSMRIDDLKVRVYGDTAVVFGLETEKSRYKSKNSTGQYRFLDTWQKRNGRWFCLSSANVRVETAKH